MEWQILSTKTISDAEGYIKILLENRQLRTKAAQKAFLEPISPTAITISDVGIDSQQLAKTLAVLDAAKTAGATVLIVGDYDADGMCATSVLWETLTAVGITAWPFVPDRERHGYGLSVAALEEALQQCQPTVLITVDNGIVAHQAVAAAEAQGLQVIVTDHHAPETVDGVAVFPAATAVLHTTQLCGTGVAWIISREIARHFQVKLPAAEHLDLVGIATIANQVPLLGWNRALVVAGLASLRQTKRVGLLALMALANVKQPEITEVTVNYVLAPRLNAMGRLRHGLEGVRLLCTKNAERARQLAATVAATNQDRQEMTQSFFLEAKLQAEQQSQWPLLITAAEHFHEGVIGLIAGRLVDHFNKPAITLAIGERHAKGSARSIPGVNIVELLRLVKDDLLAVGGHPMAAGFSVELSKIELVQQKLWQLAATRISQAMLQPVVPIETIVPWQLLTPELVVAQTKLAPFGQANPEPVIAVEKVEVLDIQTMGSDQQHLKLFVVDQRDRHAAQPLAAVAWNRASKWANLKIGQLIDVAGVLEINDWKGRQQLQLRLKDVRGAVE